MNDSSTSTLTSNSLEPLSASQLLGSSSHNAKRGASQISRSYKQASNFFLQRRFPEALLTIQPLFAQQSRVPVSNESAQGGHLAPIAGASRPNKVKVWSLYLTILNAIVELDPDEGKELFGSAVWRSILSKTRDGSIWEEVVQIGYGGDEIMVDAEVVSNLATLLITHSPTQEKTQQRLETYLSAFLDFDIAVSRHLGNSNGTMIDRARSSGTDGADTPRGLSSRIKLIELYTLHVLPRNEQWDYAKEFISTNLLLDDDIREEFMQTLQSLEDQRQGNVKEAETIQHHEMESKEEQEMAEYRAAQETATTDENNESHGKDRGHVRISSEIDYGIEDTTPVQNTRSIATKKESPYPGLPKSGRKPASKLTPNNIYSRSIRLISALRRFFLETSGTLSKSPDLGLKLLLFILALLIAMSRQNVRYRIARLITIVLDRLRKTIGMGVKISYI